MEPMFCPNCGAEYVEGIVNCRECVVPLVSELTEQVAPPIEEPHEVAPLVELLRATGQTQANLIRSLLEGSGIYVELAPNAMASVYGLSTGQVAEIPIFVPAPDLQRARDLVAAADQGELEAFS